VILGPNGSARRRFSTACRGLEASERQRNLRGSDYSPPPEKAPVIGVVPQDHEPPFPTR
jgi:hypothetical protein